MSKHVSTLNGGRIQAMLSLLRFRGEDGATSLELANTASTIDPRDVVYEMRRLGFDIVTSFDCTTHEGRKVYRYTLREEAEVA